jgi:hypothetical protein
VGVHLKMQLILYYNVVFTTKQEKKFHDLIVEGKKEFANIEI